MITVSKSAKRGFERATEIIITKRVWPDISNGKQRDLDVMEGDWRRVGKYIKSGEEKYKARKV